MSDSTVVAFTAALVGALVGGLISWRIHRASDRRSIDLSLIDGIHSLYGALHGLARADPSVHHDGFDTLAPKHRQVSQDGLRVILLLKEKRGAATLRERWQGREAAARRRAAFDGDSLESSLHTLLDDMIRAVRQMPASQAVIPTGQRHQRTLGLQALELMNEFQDSTRNALSELPRDGVDEFMVKIHEATNALRDGLDDAKRATLEES